MDRTEKIDQVINDYRAERFALGKKAMIVTGRHSSAVNGSLADVGDREIWRAFSL